MGLEWDPKKAESNYRKHGVRFSEAEPVFEDDLALTIRDADSDPEEMRFVSVGMGAMARVSRGGLRISREQHPNHFGAAGRTTRAGGL
jgi:uncharacterized DUF497 family protein